jgi:hypothetical protein
MLDVSAEDVKITRYRLPKPRQQRKTAAKVLKSRGFSAASREPPGDFSSKMQVLFRRVSADVTDQTGHFRAEAGRGTPRHVTFPSASFRECAGEAAVRDADAQAGWREGLKPRREGYEANNGPRVEAGSPATSNQGGARYAR